MWGGGGTACISLALRVLGLRFIGLGFGVGAIWGVIVKRHPRGGVPGAGEFLVIG